MQTCRANTYTHTLTSRWMCPCWWRYSKPFRASFSIVAITTSSKPSGYAAFSMWRHEPPAMKGMTTHRLWSLTNEQCALSTLGWSTKIIVCASRHTLFCVEQINYVSGQILAARTQYVSCLSVWNLNFDFRCMCIQHKAGQTKSLDIQMGRQNSIKPKLSWRRLRSISVLILWPHRSCIEGHDRDIGKLRQKWQTSDACYLSWAFASNPFNCNRQALVLIQILSG